MNSVRNKIEDILDQGSFKELWSDIYTYNYLEFTDYDEKLRVAREKSGEKDSVITGVGTIAGYKCVVAAFEPLFMMGSMGLVAGEKIARAFCFATKKRLPIITFSSSGGARMQEGVVSLVQMAKTSAAVHEHAKKNLLYISVICDPTLGGVTASFAMEADIILAEPYAHIGFAGQRVIESTIRKKLPDGFQKAEFLIEKGFIDDIVERKRQKKYIGHLLRFHSMEMIQ